MKAITALLDIVPGWMYAIGIAALLALGAGQAMHVSSLKGQVAKAKQATAQVKTEFAEFRAAAEKQRAEDEAAERKREQDLQAQADQLRSTKNAEINRLRADVRDLRYGLQHLPVRLSAGTPSGGASAAAESRAPGQVCDGGFIHRETASDLVAESERAETIRIHYLELIDLYERAQQQITGRP